jgi:DNA adenine methylase
MSNALPDAPASSSQEVVWPKSSDFGSPQFLAKPFLKWAGGKSQLLPQLRRYYPAELAAGGICRYIEPFLGGGAVYLDVVQNFAIAEAHLFDSNEELILAYGVVQREPRALIERLTEHRQRYLSLNERGRGEYFYSVRERYNARKGGVDFRAYSEAWIERAADMIFLNKTCFNGLFRVNAAGLFNVPFGRYTNPVLFEEQNLLSVSALLQNTRLHVGSFEGCEPWVDERTFVYFDPPYRPISPTSSFTSYAQNRFNDDDQRRLARFFAHLAAKSGAKLMLSNSDPKNMDARDNFFDDLYAAFSIRRLSASRMINSVGDGRGRIDEILVTNYD